MNIIEGIKANKKAIIKWGLIIAGVVVGGKILTDQVRRNEEPGEVVIEQNIEIDYEVEGDLEEE